MIPNLFEHPIQFAKNPTFPRPQHPKCPRLKLLCCPFIGSRGISKESKTPEGWNDKPNIKRQKDEDAHWTRKHGMSQYVYKNHINIDKEHRLIRRYVVTDASMHDSEVFQEVLGEENSDRSIWADSAF